MMRWIVLASLIGCGTKSIDGEETTNLTSETPSTTSTDGIDPTWHRDIAPILAEHCADCHYPGGPGPFDARDPEAAKAWAPAIVESVESGRMPPWDATPTETCEPTLEFQNDVSLDSEKLTKLRGWLDAGTPDGNAANATELPAPTPIDLESPNATLEMENAFEVSGDQDIYHCFRIPLPIDEDHYITGLQVIPDNDLVVHHALIWSDPFDDSASIAGPDGDYSCWGDPNIFPTELIGTWTPGGTPIRTPPGSASKVRAGGSIVVNMHYHPTGTSTEFDKSKIAIEWSTDEPEQFATWYLVDLPFGAYETTPPFEIPKGASNHTEEVALWNPLPLELPIFAIGPHMHYLGTAMEVTIEKDEEPEQCLVASPSYRFAYQQSYYYDGPEALFPTLGYGDTIRVKCTYDNSPSNPYYDDWLAADGGGPRDIWWGEETGDEMCMAMVGLLSPVDVIELIDSFY